ncbi:MAG: FMN-binding protein [Bacteroidota bacterium]
MKKIKIIVVSLVLVILGAVGFFFVRYQQMANTINAEYRKAQDIDLGKIADGVYPGTFGDFLVAVDLEVTVKDHRITGIAIKKQDCGPGYEALETVDRIIQAQNVRVDAVTGATGSSKSIMIAVGRALKK